MENYTEQIEDLKNEIRRCCMNVRAVRSLEVNPMINDGKKESIFKTKEIFLYAMEGSKAIDSYMEELIRVNRMVGGDILEIFCLVYYSTDDIDEVIEYNKRYYNYEDDKK